jgi:hypothetical protein
MLRITVRRCSALFFVLVVVCGGAATGQDVRIYTPVHDATAKAIVARSLTLFHGGKVYDHIDTLGEVIIFDPVNSQFILLSTQREMVATAHFDEIIRRLKIARDELQKSLAQPHDQTNPRTNRTLAALKFQLQPKFEEAWDPQQQQLSLVSPHMSYVVRCSQPERAKFTDIYLRYADWMCRLNYVLHPHAVLPGPRLAVNASLRNRQMIPVEVQLRADIESGIHLRAEHQIQWTLGPTGRKQIHHWETLLRGETVREVPLAKYQAAFVLSQAKKRR